MFWGSQAEDLEHRKMTEGQNSAGESNSERGDSNSGKGDSNGETGDSNGERENSNEDMRDSNGDRRDSKGRLLPNPVLCCESLSVRATAQVHPTLLKNVARVQYEFLCNALHGFLS